METLKRVNEFAANGGVWVNVAEAAAFVAACKRFGMTAHGGELVIGTAGTAGTVKYLYK